MTDRQEDARKRVEMNSASRRVEAVAAQRLIDEFLAEAKRRGIRPVPLRARTYAGASRKTDQQGWYLNRSGSVAVGTDGRYYRLVVPDSILARFTGVTLNPEDPPLHVGEGGRDGEGGALKWFLDRLLNDGQPRTD